MITSNGARVHDTDGNLIFTHNLDRDIAADLFGVVHNNPAIVTNVYRDDEWFMNRHRPDEMRFFKEAVFNYSLYEPGRWSRKGSARCSSPATATKTAAAGAGDQRPLGRSRERQLLNADLSGSDGGWRLERSRAGSGRENLGFA
jgi:hydroxymethylpyrimidine pyrophosphatase-like HAD family hydrolase